MLEGSANLPVMNQKTSSNWYRTRVHNWIFQCWVFCEYIWTFVWQ